jgi:hypothetical protein
MFIPSTKERFQNGTFDTVKVKGLENRELKSKLAEPRRAPDTMPDKPFLGVVCGSRGSGKSSSVINLVKLYATTHFFDKVYVFSPTFRNDPKMSHLYDERYSVKIIEDATYDALDEVLYEIKYDIEEYKEYEKYLKLWKKLMKAKDIDSFIRNCEAEEIAILENNDYQVPETKYKNGMPQSLIIFDDLVGSKVVYNNSSLNKFLLQHRHYLTSILFSVQVWKGAVPRGIRNNLSLMIMFSNKSIPIKQEIAEELSAYITPDKFMDMWDFACKEPHDFFMINFDSKDKKFRRNFNEIIILDNNKNDSDSQQ